MKPESRKLIPIQKPSGWNNRSKAQRLFQDVPFCGTRWHLYRKIKAELGNRNEDVLEFWQPFTEDGFDCIETVLKPIKQSGWPNHFFVPADDFALLSEPLGLLDVLNEICLRCGIGAKGKNHLTDALLYADCLPRFSDIPEEFYTGTIGTLVTYIKQLHTNSSLQCKCR